VCVQESDVWRGGASLSLWSNRSVAGGGQLSARQQQGEKYLFRKKK
jgi:hypothetical protein